MKTNHGQIWSCWEDIPEIQVLSAGKLLDGYWDDLARGFFCIFYEPEDQILVKWLDTSIKPMVNVRGEIPGIEPTQVFDPMKDRNVMVTEIPIESGKTTKTIFPIDSYRKIGKKIPQEMIYFHQKGLTPGIMYTITDTCITPLAKGGEEIDEIRRRLLGEYDDIVELAVMNVPLYNSPITELRRTAFDIEVSSPRGVFPTPEQAEYPVHAVGFYDSMNKATIFLLDWNPNQELRAINEKLINKKLGYLPEIKAFTSEKKLLDALFEMLGDYPLLLSYNGDNFDLPYLMNRGRKLGLDPPIYRGHYRGQAPEYHVKNTIHVDLMRFFQNNAVRLYAFGGKYSRNRLDDVAEALLGSKKVEHDLWFDEMSTEQLIHYTITDVQLTYELSAYNDNLAWKIMVMLMRVGKMTLSYVNRESISKWILNWIAHEHSSRGWVLPEARDIIQAKGDFLSKSMGDKQYQGAIVFEPEAGIFWDVLVADYASLYPSVIKKFNLSYETIRCNHQSCKSNKVPGFDDKIAHWVCRKKVGIMSSLVGFVRDVRVRWYKGKKDAFSKTIQAALKVFINASYGVFGAKTFDLFCPPVAESTTAYARRALLGAKAEAEKMNLRVLYGDTDSIFIHRISQEQFTHLKLWSVVQLGIELGIDYKFRFLVMSGRKKNYFGVMDNGGLIVKGLTVKKRDTAIFIQEAFTEVTDVLKEVYSPDELEQAIETMKAILRDSRLKLMRGEVPLEKLAKMATLNKNFDEYKSPTLGLQAAIQIMDKENEKEYQQGSQFMVVSIKPREVRVKTSRFSNYQRGSVIRCTVSDISKIVSYREVNLDKYEEQMRKAFQPILDAFDLDWTNIVTNTISLEQFF